MLASPDTFIDFASLTYNVYTGNYAAARWDAASLMIPGITGLGALSHTDDALRLLNRADAVADTVRSVNAVDNFTDTARSSNNAIQLYGFKGTVQTAEHFIDTEPLIYAGHVGISFDAGKTIFGFSPYAPGLSNRQVIETLKERTTSFPGQVLDDTAIFHRAQDLAEQGYQTRVYVQSSYFSESEFNQIYNNVLREIANSPLPLKRYSFPGLSGCFNCATWPSTIGVPIPEATGRMKYYMEELLKVGKPWIR